MRKASIDTLRKVLTKPLIVTILFICVYTKLLKVMFLRVFISNRSSKPIYEQIKDQVKEAIFSDDLRENDLLPSIRQLAKDLKISVITTARAYNDLEEEGFIVNVQGKGCYVLPKNMDIARENVLLKVESALAEAAAAAKAGGLTKSEVTKMLNTIYKEEHHE